MEKKGHKLLLAGTIVAYLLIGFEILVMISPFALYFYGVYGPILDFLGRSPLTSWTTEFFLPHMVFPADPFLVGILFLQVLLVAGLVLFLLAAVPLYYGKFSGRGVVQASFYSRIRHPQYLFLAISGFGLLLYWPRFIILVMYITMLFVYYLLARNEEWRMKRKHPDSYGRYMEKIPMFLPGEPGGRVYEMLFGWVRPKWLGIAFLYVGAVFGAVMIAMGVRAYTISCLPVTLAADSTVLVPVFDRPGEEVVALYELVLADEEASRHLAQKKGAANLAYIMPGDFFLTALVTDNERRFSDEMMARFPEILEWRRHKFSGGLGRFFRIYFNFIKNLGMVETDYDVERFVFVSVREADGTMVPPDQVFDLGVDREAVLIVDIDAFSHEVLGVLPTTGNHKWGQMPMPLF